MLTLVKLETPMDFARPSATNPSIWDDDRSRIAKFDTRKRKELQMTANACIAHSAILSQRLTHVLREWEITDYRSQIVAATITVLPYREKEQRACWLCWCTENYAAYSRDSEYGIWRVSGRHIACAQPTVPCSCAIVNTVDKNYVTSK